MINLLLYDDCIDFHLIGVYANFDTSIQFIYNLNHTYNTSFQRIEDLDILINNSTHYFEAYEWSDKYSKIDYHMIKNASDHSDSEKKEVNLSNLFNDNVILIPNYRECNYLIKISGWEHSVQDFHLPFDEKGFFKKIERLDINSISNADRLVF